MANKNLDDFLTEFGNPGRLQLWYGVIIILTMIQWTLIQQFNIIISYIPDHHCKLPSENWSWPLNESIPIDHKCSMYANPSNLSEGIIPCPNGFEYKTINGELYPSNEFDLICDRENLFRLSLIFPYVGVIIGGIIFGHLSDKYGRQKTLVCLMPIVCVLTVGTAYSPNLYSLIIIRFFSGVFTQGVQTTCLTYTAELFRRQMRTVMSCVFGIIAAILLPVQAYMMYFLPSWRSVQIVQGGLILLSVIANWFLPESVTWLIQEGKLSKSEKILEKFAKYNKIPLSPTLKKDLQEQKQAIVLQKNTKSNSGGCKTMTKLFCNTTMRRIMFSTMYMMFASACVLSGLSFSISALPGNVYSNFLVNGGIQIVVMAISLAVFSRYGRVKVLFILFIASGILSVTGFNLMYYFKHNHPFIHDSAIYMALISRNLIASATAMVITYSSELIPTFLRSTGLGVIITASRIGATVSPEILYSLDNYWTPLPHTLYGGLLLLSALTITFLPETFNHLLPRTIQDVEVIISGQAVADEERPLLQENMASRTENKSENKSTDYQSCLNVSLSKEVSNREISCSKSY